MLSALTKAQVAELFHISFLDVLSTRLDPSRYVLYLRTAAGRRSYFPDLTLPPSFDRKALDSWTERSRSARLRTLVSRRLAKIIEGASVEA
jgi:hypothetical protein